MGGKGRGVFSDFRMGRVCHGILFGRRRADDPIVSISRKRSRGEPAGREEGKLVAVLLREPDWFHVQSHLLLATHVALHMAALRAHTVRHCVRNLRA